MQTGHFVLRVPASLEGFGQAASELRGLLDQCRVTGGARYRAELVFEEVATNVIRHGQISEAAPHIDVSLECVANSLILTFEDNGRPFDPLQRPEPERPRSIGEASLGGLGILLVRKACKDIRYERTPDDRNRLTVTIAA